MRARSCLLITVGGSHADMLVPPSAAFYCIGDLMAAFGAQVMSFMNEIAAVALKAIRTSANVSLPFDSTN